MIFCYCSSRANDKLIYEIEILLGLIVLQDVDVLPLRVI